MPVWSLSDSLKFGYKILLFGSFVIALTAFSIWFVGFTSDIYNIISNASNSVLDNNIPDTLGCLIHILGIDAFLTSAFAIFFSASAFWLIAVGYIISFKLGLKVYDGLFKVAS